VVARGNIKASAASVSGDAVQTLGLVRAAWEHADELLGFLICRTREDDVARDLRQEVFLRLSRTPANGDIGDVRAYCFRIARNLIVDHHRQRRAEARIFDNGGGDMDAPSETVTPEIELTGRQELEQLRAAVDELAPHLRQALLWARLEGLKLAEIGRRLGVSESMAGRYVTQALTHCQARLSREG
jgi:RNA polymerase sigma factor (sigma-70 family)